MLLHELIHVFDHVVEPAKLDPGDRRIHLRQPVVRPESLVLPLEAGSGIRALHRGPAIARGGEEIALLASSASPAAIASPSNGGGEGEVTVVVQGQTTVGSRSASFTATDR